MLNNGIITELSTYEAETSIYGLIKRYEKILNRIKAGEGCYIWGSAKLGQYCFEQFERNGIPFKGFIDNDQRRYNEEKRIYLPDRVKTEDIVIIASFYYPQIINQLEKMGNKYYIYYEELAYIMDGFATYYPAFEGIFDELERNRKEYIGIFDVLGDEISKEVYANIIKFRMTLNCDYTKKAEKLSLEHGIQDFDEVITGNFTPNTSFYDVGGFDGQSTLDFVQNISRYNKIYFFEPDPNIIETTKERLRDYDNIEFLQTVVGNKTCNVNYDAIGGGAGKVSESGIQSVPMVILDDFVHDSDSYIKLDVEGFELSALEGCEKAIKRYKPMLSVSVYHKPGDMHILIKKILSWNPNYKVYLRHYTETYADTRVYFIDVSN